MTRFRPHSRTGRSSAPLDSRSAVAVSIVGGGWRRAAVVAHQARPAVSSVHRTDAENHRAAAAGDAPLVRWRAAARVDARTPLTGIYAALIPEIHLRPRFPDAPGSACHRHKVTRVECRERERPALQPSRTPFRPACRNAALPGYGGHCSGSGRHSTSPCPPRPARQCGFQRTLRQPVSQFEYRRGAGAIPLTHRMFFLEARPSGNLHPHADFSKVPPVAGQRRPQIGCSLA